MTLLKRKIYKLIYTFALLFVANNANAQSLEQRLFQAGNNTRNSPPFQGDMTLLIPFESEWNNAVKLAFQEKYGREFNFPNTMSSNRTYDPNGIDRLLNDSQSMALFGQSDQEDLLNRIVEKARRDGGGLSEVNFDSALTVWANSKGNLPPDLINDAAKGDPDKQFCLWLIWCGSKTK